MEVNSEIILKSDVPQSTKLTKFIFVLFGVSSLLAWNAFLTELDFFNCFISIINPYKSIPFINYAPNIIIQFLLLWKKDLFKISNQLIFGLVASIILLIAIPISIIIFESHQNLNAIIAVIFFLFMGFVNAFLCSGFFSLVSSFPFEMIVALSAGQGVSGIILNIIQYIILPFAQISDDNEKNKEKQKIIALIFFSISIVILIVTLIFLLFSLQSEYFKYYLNGKKDEKSKNEDQARDTPAVDNQIEEDENNDLDNYHIKKDLKMSFLGMVRLLLDIDLLIVLIYIVTFSVFPVGFQGLHLFKIDGGTSTYYLNTILLIFNTFDTVGRYLVSAIKPTKRITYITVLTRIILIVTIPLSYYYDKHVMNHTLVSIFIIINDILLAVTNGIGTTLCFGLAPTLVNNELKAQAGASVSFFIIVGIFLGSTVALFLTGHLLDTFN